MLVFISFIFILVIGITIFLLVNKSQPTQEIKAILKKIYSNLKELFINIKDLGILLKNLIQSILEEKENQEESLNDKQVEELQDQANKQPIEVSAKVNGTSTTETSINEIPIKNNNLSPEITTPPLETQKTEESTSKQISSETQGDENCEIKEDTSP